MKKVWVNRFNHDGSMKPMRDWQLKEFLGTKTHYCHFLGRFIDSQSENILLPNENVISKRGLLREYIGNQMGDGWFYCATHDLPPTYQEVIAFDKNGHCEVSMLTAIVCDTPEWHGCEPVCWQPVSQPEFLESL